MIFGLRGQGGVGKTTLALVLAHELAGQYPDAEADAAQVDAPRARLKQGWGLAGAAAAPRAAGLVRAPAW